MIRSRDQLKRHLEQGGAMRCELRPLHDGLFEDTSQTFVAA